MKLHYVATHFLVLTLLLAGCSGSLSSTDGGLGSSATAEARTTIQTSKDGVVKLTVPDGWQDIWTEADKEQWSLLVGKRSELLQLGVRSIAKADFPAITPEAHAQAALTAGTAPFSEPEILENGKQITVNGHPAVLYRTVGTVSGQRLATYSLSVETPGYYHGIFVAGPEQTFVEHEAEVEHIIQSLQEAQETVSTQ
ncbi:MULTISPECIES: hypothetical protein [unclassified Leptolyngbya]|uniref:hypothetical protein n=1 Tax=unclassified Leptolyngbya TaxID=2650499 RepID=UPI001689C50D|nr:MULTISPECIES: hypothetical protein [unclassified Leptolyngbya]MBD1913633.1 hypothetical protein [Leptolyngbya sp. FACHB-8]MBD2154036.1 hypothetical protein [Leptolyngbya sp. FACHB-16]